MYRNIKKHFVINGVRLCHVKGITETPENSMLLYHIAVDNKYFDAIT